MPGRFERVDEGQPFVVVVDYAHTDDALRNVIAVARGLNPKRVITLFGCGGDRDRTKRPLMGQAAAEASDFVVLTSDNPRSEDPLAIMNDALVGMRRTMCRTSWNPTARPPSRAPSRRRATGDIVILAGKGHETYQVLKDRTIAFDDREVAREVLRGYGYHEIKSNMTLDLQAVAQAMGARGAPAGVHRGMERGHADTEPGDVYFALRGPNSDGHEFVRGGIEKGAAAVVVERASGAVRTNWWLTMRWRAAATWRAGRGGSGVER